MANWLFARCPLFLCRFLGRALGCDQHSHLLEGVKVLDVDATMRSTGDMCSQDTQECFNPQERFSRLLQPIKHYPKQQKRETMGRQMLAKLCSSTAVDDGVTLRASAAHAYNAKLHDLLNLCSALKSPCRVHAI